MRPLLAALLALVLVAAACTDGDDDTTPAGGPARGTLRVAVPGAESPEVNANILETLVRLQPDLTIAPMLAEQWELVPPNTWRFRLRPGVTFHDGQPLNAAAVKAGLFDRVAIEALGGLIGVGADSTRVVDDLTLEFTPVFPNLRVPEMLAHPSNVVYAPGTDRARPVGTGPFRLTETSETGLVMERYDGYWGAKAKAERIEYVFQPEAAERVDALAKGRVDVAFPIPPQTAEALANSGLEVGRSAPGISISLYAAVHGIPPHNLLGDVSLRKAVTQAIDRRRLVSEVLGGVGRASQTHAPPIMLGHHADKVEALPHDPGKARELLDAAGWAPGEDGIRVKEGRRLELTLISGYPTADVNRPIPSFIEEELKEVGIAVTITETPTRADYVDAIRTSAGDLYLEQGTQSDGNPAFLPMLITTAATDWAAAFGPGAAYDAALSESFTSPDLEGARAATAAALEIAVEQEAAVIPLAVVPRVFAWSPGAEGIVPHATPFWVRWDTAVFAGDED